MERKKITWINRCIIIFSVWAIFIVGICVACDQYFRLPDHDNQEDLNANLGKTNSTGKEIANAYDFGNFNVLILGLDGRKGLNDRSDTIILASLNQAEKKAQLLSIPRDTRVKIKGGWDKINAAYVYGGVDLTKKTISDLLGVEIDRYVIINFEGLTKVVDLVGGIEVNVPVRMYKPLEGINLKPGFQHLDGEQVLGYARFRGTKNGDIDRARRQQEVIQLLSEKLIEENNFNQLLKIIESAYEEVETDLTIKEIGALARLASPVLENGIDSEVLPGENQFIDEIWYWKPDLANLSEIVAISKEETATDQGSADAQHNL